MPKGVEHLSMSLTRGCVKQVKEPLMPKGVEHLDAGMTQARNVLVKEPLMPKGVEHVSFGELMNDAFSERTFDAERR